MPKVVRNDTQGLHQVSGKGAVGVRNIQVASLVASAAATEYTTASDVGIVQPANSVLLNVHVLVSTALAAASSNIGLRIGTAAGGAELMTLDADSLVAGATSLAAGKGTSTEAEVATALGGAATAVIVADSGFSASERTIFPEVVASGGSITAGELQVFCEFLQF